MDYETDPLTALQAAPLLRALVSLTPAPEWTDFERDFINETITMCSRIDNFTLSVKQTNILIKTYYKHVLLPKVPALSPAGQAKAKEREAQRAARTPNRAPVRRDMKDANDNSEAPF
jgi:hypothetical protein